MDNTGRFVAEYHWVFDDEVADTAMDEVVYIRTADTGLLYSDEDLILLDYVG